MLKTLKRDPKHGRPQTFFIQARAKFSRGGKNILFAFKILKNILFSLKKVEKHTILASQGGASAPSCPRLRTSMTPKEWLL